MTIAEAINIKDKFVPHPNPNPVQPTTFHSKLITFNPSKAIDVHPVIEKDDKQLEIVKSMKLLRVIVTSYMKWHQNTDFITQKGFSRLWILRSLKRLGLPKDELLDRYMKK